MKTFLRKLSVLPLVLSFLFTLSWAYAQSGEELYQQAVSQQANEAMQQIKDEATLNLEFLKDRINNVPRNDARRQMAQELIGNAVSVGQIEKTGLEKEVETLVNMNNADHIKEIPGVGNAPPTADFSDDFKLQLQKVEDGFAQVNRILLSPARPGEVPEGDIVEDFIPNLVRQLFRFGWLAVFISFVASGVMFVLAAGNDDRVDKAKKILYFSLVGFAFIALAFAIVRGVTNIDFFRNVG